jgi:hypothetical protein
MPRQPEPPDGGSRRTRSTTTPRPTRAGHRAARTDHDEAAPASGRAGLGGLLRGPGSVLGGLSGIDGASRSLERLSRSSERAADFLDRLEEEVGWERAVELVDRLSQLAGAVEGMHASMQEMEAMLADLHEHFLPAPPRRKPAPSRARR